MTDAPPPPPGDKLPDLRASDADRERTADQLRTAASEGRLSVEELEERVRLAYTLPTCRELEKLVADVTLRPGVPVTRTGVTVREGPGGTRSVISIMGGHDRKGRWRIAEHCRVLHILGGSDIDLNDAELSGAVTVIRALAIIGGGEIRVPDGVEVEVSGFAIIGGNDVRLGDQVAPPGAPLIRLHLVSVIGGISVRRGRKLSRAERRRRRELRKTERRGELEP
jgi:hypothetical protein